MANAPHVRRVPGGLSRRRLLQMGALGLVGVGVPLLGACGGENTAGSDRDDEGGSGEARPDRSAILKWGSMRAESLDPIRQVAGTEEVWLNAIFDTLLTISPIDGTIGPRLAEEWEVDGQRIRLTLRDGVTFQDNTPFDAEAVKFNLDRVLSDPDSNIRSRIPQLARVRVVDDGTVDLELSEPTPLAVLMALTNRPGMMASPTAVREAGSSAAFSEAPVGCGMYRVEGAWHPRESLSVRAWDGYWDPDAQTLGGIDFTEVAMSQKVNALRSGSIDIASFEGFDVSALEQEDSIRLTVGPAPRGRGLTVNSTIAPLDDLRVRQAIAHAIDREAVVEALTSGYGEPRYQPFASDSPAYDPELDDLYTYDPDRARDLLAEAGYEDGLSFRSIVGGTATSYVTFGELLQAQLREVDIDMDLELVDQASTIPQLFEQDRAASAPIGGGATAAETDLFIRQYYLRDGAFNAGNTEVRGIRTLLRRAGASPDTDAARVHYREINRRVLEDLQQIIPVYAEAAITGHQDYVGGLTRAVLDTDINPELLRGIYITEGREPAPEDD
ncbi:MAG TPA: ABC transporter substrate-binding protein [Acidimicrobiales bacterium]